jgi:ribonuclease E
VVQAAPEPAADAAPIKPKRTRRKPAAAEVEPVADAVAPAEPAVEAAAEPAPVAAEGTSEPAPPPRKGWWQRTFGNN